MAVKKLLIQKKSKACPFCRGQKAVKAGFRQTDLASKQLFLCKKCGRRFTQDDGYLRMRFPPKAIQEAMDLRKRGFSLAEIRLRLERKGVRVSRWGIAKWARKFGR